MIDALRATEEFLQDQYLNLLQVRLVTSSAKVSDDVEVRWQWQNADLKNVGHPDDASGGVVLDEQIGLCLYVQCYSPETDLRAQLARALAIRSELLPGRQLDPKDGDTNGEWHVGVHWLVEGRDLPEWITQIAQIRHETAHFEEVPVDAIVNDGSDWNRALSRHGFPRLLFHTRSSLAHKVLDDAKRWANADEVVRKHLQAIPRNVTDPKMAPYVAQLVKTLAAIGSDDATEVRSDGDPIDISTIALENFRNVRSLSLDLRAPGQIVAANVVHGPNGSGKTAILEALSLALGSVSQRYIDYLQDYNVGSADKRRTYLEQYLTPLHASNNSSPRLGVNIGDLRSIELAQPENAAEAYAKLSGNIYLTSAGTSPLSRKANELGAEIAGGFSVVANAVLDWVDNMVTSADAKRDALNRRLGIRTNTTRNTTARLRIVEAKILGALNVSDHVMQWIRMAVGPFIRNDQRGLPEEWNKLLLSQAVELRRLAHCDTKQEVRTAVGQILAKRNELLGRVDLTLHRAQLAKTQTQDSLESEIRTWGEWAAAHPQVSSPVETGEIAALRESLEKASSRVAEITKEGQALRERIKHFESIRTFLQSHWVPTHPSTCPTCNTHLPNGIATAMDYSEQVTRQDIELKRREFQDAQQELASVTSKLDKRAQCPHPSMCFRSCALFLAASWTPADWQKRVSETYSLMRSLGLDERLLLAHIFYLKTS
jgi:hypothetical protein